MPEPASMNWPNAETDEIRASRSRVSPNATELTTLDEIRQNAFRATGDASAARLLVSTLGCDSEVTQGYWIWTGKRRRIFRYTGVSRVRNTGTAASCHAAPQSAYTFSRRLREYCILMW